MSSPAVLIALVFGFLVVLGGGVAIIAGWGRGNVDERLEQFVSTDTFLDIPEEEITVQGPDAADKLDKALSTRSFFGPIRTRIAKADVKLRVSEYLTLTAISAIGVGAIGYYLVGGPIFAVIGAVIGMRLPRTYIGIAAGRRVNAFNDQLGDTLNLWVNALRSGYSVLQAMETIATELPPPVSREFERVVQEVRLGLSMEQALENMYRRVPSEDLDLVITAVNIQREVGGNLAEVLDTISFTIRERVRIKGEVRTLTAQGRVSGWIISLLPIGLALLLNAINPGYVSQLWAKQDPYLVPGVFPCGWLLLAVGGLMIGAGAFAISKIVDIEV
jgi:tight adherence protein B